MKHKINKISLLIISPIYVKQKHTLLPFFLKYFPLFQNAILAGGYNTNLLLDFIHHLLI